MADGSEQTSKVWKGRQLIGAGAAGLGTIVSLGAWAARAELLTILGLALLAFGGVTFVFARIGAWWDHG